MAEAPIHFKPSPLHARVAELSRTNLWVPWFGYTAPLRFGDVAREARALGDGIAIADFAPYPFFEVTGKDAGVALDRLLTRAASALPVGGSMDALICAGTGHLISICTVVRLEEARFALFTAAECGPQLARAREGLDVTIARAAQLPIALLGPERGLLLAEFGINQHPDEAPFLLSTEWKDVGLTIANLPTLLAPGGGASLLLVAEEDADLVWDRLVKAGATHDLAPVGLEALNRTRIELGVPQEGAEFTSPLRALSADQLACPAELGLADLVEDDGRAFTGAHALRSITPTRQLVQIEVDECRDMLGEAVRAENRKVGVVTSAFIDRETGVARGLALVDRDAGSALTVGPMGSDAPAFVTPVTHG